MKIIIEIKDTATLERIAELSKALCHMDNSIQGQFPDVIKEISKEW